MSGDYRATPSGNEGGCMGADQEAIVREYLAAWTGRDADRLADYFIDNAIWHESWREPVVGRHAIREELAFQISWATDFDLQVLTLATTGNSVMTERSDRFVMNGHQIAVPVAGVFDLDDDGKFIEWRDYYDWNKLSEQLVTAGIDVSGATT
jgi:limonene-1,2-epoxide hydrolase